MVDPNTVKAIFLAAIERPPAERAAFLEQAVGGDDALRARVATLLKAHDERDSFLDAPASPIEPSRESPSHKPLAEVPGSLIGPYKLLQQIGEGGMGVVYMADQQAPVRRRVALKIIKAGMDTRQVIARFEAERQALALMDHPNIARVLDAGATDSGRPYFVMELVRGVPITEYSDQNNLPVHERLELFVLVCHAVQHAHQKGIVHRDLKPTNVLVTRHDGRAVPKVIDFGVAKATGQQLTEKTLFTAFSQMVGTPLYMSPEQAEMTSIDIDTRSDIYSLGVLLYELLTGTTPFDQQRMRAAAFDEIRRIIREEEPPTPSTRLSTLGATRAATAAHRQVEPNRLSRLLKGDLDWIVMKALEKDRARRYDTAGNFAADVLRYLSDQPVEACPPTWMYRFCKFARRNRVGVLAGSSIIAALVLGMVVSTWQALRADREARNAVTQAARSQQVAQFLKDMLAAAGPSVARGRDDTVLREILDKTAERVEKDLHHDPEVQGDLWFTLGSTFQDIGDYQKAIALLKQAVNSYRVALGDQNTKLARALGLLGSCQSFATDIAGGRANGQLGLDMARKCGDRDTLAFCLLCRARSSNWWGMGSTESVPYLREAIALRRQLGTDPIALADCLRALGTCEAVAPVENYDCTLEALEIYRQQLGTENPRYATALFLQGQLLINRRAPVVAEKVLRETLMLWQKIYDRGHPIRPIVHRFLAESLALQGDWDGADAILRESPANAAAKGGDYNLFFNDVIRHLKDWGQLDEALAEAQKTFDSRSPAELQESPTMPDRIFSQLGFRQVQRQRWPEAVATFTRLVEFQPAVPSNYHALGALLVQAGDVEGYARFRRQAIAEFAGTSDRTTSEWIAKDCLILPLSGPELDVLAQMAEMAVTDKEEVPASHLPWIWYVKGLAEYRQAHYASAIDWLQRASPDEIEGQIQQRFVEAHSVMAMSHFRLNNSAAARKELARGKLELEKFPSIDSDVLFRGKGMAFADWIIARVLVQEAQALIESDSKATPDGKRP